MSDIPGKPAGAAAVADDPHRVMVVDDHPMWRDALVRDLEQHSLIRLDDKWAVAESHAIYSSCS